METQFTKRTYTTSQTSLLMKSMLIAGIAFLILGACSYGFSVLFYNTVQDNFGLGLGIFFIMLLSGMIVSMLWTANMLKNGSVFLTILCYLFYITSTSVAFGWLFSIAMMNIDAYWLPVMFAIVGAIFLLTTLIAKATSINGVITMGKIVAICAVVMGILMLAFFILMMVSCFVWNQGVFMAGDVISSLVMFLMSIMSFVYIIWDIWSISKISEFAENSGQEFPKIMAWFCGYKLLTDLVNILFVVLWYVIRFGRRR